MKRVPKSKVVPMSPEKFLKTFPPVRVFTVWQLFKGEHLNAL